MKIDPQKSYHFTTFSIANYCTLINLCCCRLMLMGEFHRSQNILFTLRSRAREATAAQTAMVTIMSSKHPPQTNMTWRSGQSIVMPPRKPSWIVLLEMLHQHHHLPRKTLPRLLSMDVSWPTRSVMTILPRPQAPPLARITRNKALNWVPCHRGRQQGSHWLAGVSAVEWKVSRRPLWVVHLASRGLSRMIAP